jgi:formylglycine-generating enzyme required for sulfatase activity
VSALPRQAFDFTTVTVDHRGAVIETRPGQVQRCRQDLGRGSSLDLVALPAGTLLMGSARSAGYDDERPQHPVSLAPFLIGQVPVTQSQWLAVMGRLPPYRFEGGQRPVENVSWQAARQFCQRLAKKTGRAYELPSEAQWEYACRAGTLGPFAFGPTLTTDLANYVGEHVYGAGPRGVYRHATTHVGGFPPNAFGLFDLHGNVWEWCADAWHPSYEGAPAGGRPWEAGGDQGQRVMRGGSWHDPPDNCRSAARSKFSTAEGEDYIGFRVALTVRR